MSLSAALNNATSGLTAATRSAEVVSSNVANALTEGYARREIRLASSSVGGQGGGVTVASIERIMNHTVTNDRRLSESDLGFVQKELGFYQTIERVLADPTSEGSLTSRLTNLEASLVSAAANPSDEIQLANVLRAANQLADTLNSSSREIQKQRQAADQEISFQVDTINASLSAVDDLNNRIQAIAVSGGNISGLQDERQRQIDAISDLIPIREIPKEFGRVALASPNGTLLVADGAAKFSFRTTPIITSEMTLASGALSGLTLEGASSSAGSVSDVIAGGSLDANFMIRDHIGPETQQELDGFAAKLIELVTDPQVDSSITTGPGLFSDAGNAFDPVDEIGLASRILVNPSVDPNKGGDITRIRDGVNSTTPMPVGFQDVLTSLTNVFSGTEPDGTPASDMSIFSSATSLTSSLSSARISSEASLAFNEAKIGSLLEAEGVFGVDTDQELQNLLAIEQSYAANAKLIEAIDEMLQSLLRI